MTKGRWPFSIASALLFSRLLRVLEMKFVPSRPSQSQPRFINPMNTEHKKIIKMTLAIPSPVSSSVLTQNPCAKNPSAFAFTGGVA